MMKQCGYCGEWHTSLEGCSVVPNNAGTVQPLPDEEPEWRRSERVALLGKLNDALGRAETAERELAEARGLLNSAVFWVRPHNGELARVIDALLAKHEVPK